MQKNRSSALSIIRYWFGYLHKLNIRDNQKLLKYTVVAVLLLIGVYIRIRLIPGINGDYTIYISNWYDHLKNNGFAGFKDNFANYNFPYLFLLYIGTLLPIPKLLIVKLIAIAFDFLLALGVYKLVSIVTKSKTRAIFALLLALFLPTVLVNAAYWGQTDVIYTSFIVFTLAALFTGHYRIMWLIFGVAIAFKLQAIFFAPVLAYVWFKKKGVWWAPFITLGAFIALSIPPVFAGKSLKDSLGVYVNQYGFEPLLSANVPNFYYWLPQNYYEVINGSGVLFAVAITIIITYAAILRMKYNTNNILFFAMLMAAVIPYILPQMHDRYFFMLEIFLVILAMVNKKFIVPAIIMQGVTILVYAKTLFGYKELPFSILAGVVTILVVFFIYYFVRDHLKIKDINTDEQILK